MLQVYKNNIYHAMKNKSNISQLNTPARGKARNRRRNRRQNSSTVSTVGRIPSYYPRAPGDTMSMPFKFTGLLLVPPSAGTVGKLLVLGKGTNTGDYIFLNTICAQFSALQAISSRWMLTDLKVQVRATGVGGTANSFIAASYIPSNTGIDNPPTDLLEVSQAIHYAESSLGTVGNLSVQPTDYFNDWRQVNDSADNSDSQVGLIQLYGSGVSTSDPVTAGVYTVSGNLVFCGLRL